MTEKNPDFILLPSDASEDKVSQVLMEIQKETGNIEVIKKQIEKLKARADASKKRIDQRRAAIEKWMLANEHKTKRFPEATLTLATARPKVIITDEDALPLDCFTEKVVLSVNKDLVKAMLLTGRPLEGATLSNAAPELRLKF